MSEITTVKTPAVNIIQSVAILIDGNNIERSLHSMTKDENCMINFDNLIPKLLRGRGLSRLIYFREGKQISSKLANRLLEHYMGSVVPCHKSADIPLSIAATQIARKVDTIIILSGDSDYVELLRHLKGEGVRIEIAAVKATTAQILVDEADHFIEITEDDSFSLNPKRLTNNKRSNSTSTHNRRDSKKPSTNIKEVSNKTTNKENTKSDSSNKSTSSNKATRKSTERKPTSRKTSKTEKKPSTKKPSEKKTKKTKATTKTKSKTPKRAARAPKRKRQSAEPLDDFSY